MATVTPTGKGTSTLLARYLLQLTTHPLRTKSATAAVLSFLQEVIGSNVAGVPAKRPPKDAPFLIHALARARIDLRAVQMAGYGFFISAPLNHLLVGNLQKLFVGKVSAKWRLAQLLANNVLVAPITTAVYLASMAIINGAKSFEEVLKTVKAGFFPVIRVMWVVSPTAMIVAQKFIPVDLWVPFFNLVQFTIGTLFNIKVKKMKLAAAQAAAKKEREEREKREKESNP